MRRPDLGPTRTPATSVGCVHNGFTVNNAAFLKTDINDSQIYGGRAALKIDLDDNWTVTPTIMHQTPNTVASPVPI